MVAGSTTRTKAEKIKLTIKAIIKTFDLFLFFIIPFYKKISGLWSSIKAVWRNRYL